MISLALDASLFCSGYAITKDRELLDLGKFVTKQCKKTPTEEERLFAIYKFFEQMIDNCQIERIVMEAQYVGKNAKTSMILARLRGAVIILAKIKGIELVTYEPSAIKRAVCGEGKGNANKFEVYDGIRALYEDYPLVQQLLPKDGCVDKHNKDKNDDISDALAVAHTDLLYQKEAA